MEIAKKANIHTLETDRFIMDYATFGRGDKVFVIIPGLSLKSVLLSADAVAAAYQEFAGNYTVYLFDRKRNIQGDYTIRDMAKDTAAAMKQLGISQADIFGASMGGMIAQYIAIDYPELVHKLVIGSSISRHNNLSRSVIGNWIKLAEAGDKVTLNKDCFAKLYSTGFLEAYHDVLSSMEKEGSAEELMSFARQSRSVLGFNSYAELSKIKCPVLVMGAKNDKVFTAQPSLEIAEKLGCEAYIYDDFGHAVYDEAPDYRERMISFFAKA